MKLLPYDSDERRIQKIAYPVFSPGIVYLLFSAFIQEFRNWELAWALEALYVVVYEVRILAEKGKKLVTFVHCSRNHIQMVLKRRCWNECN
ncbi:hypothetical protein LXL04_020588 [Taraxacum kok-saghyz]